MTKTSLPKTGEQPKHRFSLHIPIPLWRRMIAEGHITWGTTTQFIITAIEEKLNRTTSDKKGAKQQTQADRP